MFQADGKTLLGYDPFPILDDSLTKIAISTVCKKCRGPYTTYSANIEKSGYIDNFGLRVAVDLTVQKTKRFVVAKTYPSFTFSVMIGGGCIESINSHLCALLLSQDRLREQRQTAISFASTLFSTLRACFPTLICNKIVSYVLLDKFDDVTLTNMCQVAPIQLQDAMCDRRALWTVEYPITTGLDYICGRDYIFQESLGEFDGPIVAKAGHSLQLSYRKRRQPLLTPQLGTYGYYEQSEGSSFVHYVEMEASLSSDNAAAQTPDENTSCVTFGLPYRRPGMLFTNAILVHDVTGNAVLTEITVSCPGTQMTFDVSGVQLVQNREWYALPLNKDITRPQDVLQSKTFDFVHDSRTPLTVSIKVAKAATQQSQKKPQTQTDPQLRCYLQYAEQYYVAGNGLAGLLDGSCATVKP